MSRILHRSTFQGWRVGGGTKLGELSLRRDLVNPFVVSPERPEEITAMPIGNVQMLIGHQSKCIATFGRSYEIGY